MRSLEYFCGYIIDVLSTYPNSLEMHIASALSLLAIVATNNVLHAQS